MRLTVIGLFASAALASSAYGQQMISAHSGVVQYVEGDVSIENKPVELKFGHFPDIKPNQIVRTQEGRAEVLLTPGSFLRLAENSEVKMISNQLTDTRFELLSGEILVESVDFMKDKAAAMVKGNVISVIYKGSTTTLVKPGLFEFKAEPGRLRVFEGEANVKVGTELMTLKRGKETGLEGDLVAGKFDSKSGDELTRWSSRRSSYVATANVTSAQTLATGGGGGGWYNNSFMGGGWAWNPGFGMFTYVPFGGMAFSPFGYSYWSPYTINQFYGSYFGGYGGLYGGGYGNYYGGGNGNVYRSGGNTGGNSAALAGNRSSIGSANYGHPAAIGGAARSTGFSGASVAGGGMSRGAGLGGTGNGGFTSAGSSASGVSSAAASGGGGAAGRSAGASSAGGSRGR